MNKFFTDLQQEAREIRLSAQEKQAMRMHVYQMMDASPAYTPAQEGVMAEVEARRNTPSMYHWLNPRFMVSLAVLLVAGLSGGTAFAAQSALPGEPLYAVKIQVNEKVAVALAITPAAKAEVNARLATTRLEEAETLASQGTLDATTTTALAGNFAAHAEAAEANTVTVASSDPGTAAQIGTTFSSTLAAHGAILAQLAADAGTSSVQVNSDALAVQVLTQATHDRANNDAGQDMHQGAGGAVVSTLAISPTGEGIEVSALRTGGGVKPAAGDVNGDAANNTAPETVDSKTQVQVTALSAVAPQAVSVSALASTSAAKVSATLSPAASTTDASNDTNNKIKSISAATSKTFASASISNDDGEIALALGSQASTTLSLAAADFAAIAPSLDASTADQITLQITDLQEMLMQGNDMLMAGDNSKAKLSFNHVLRVSVRLDAFLKAGKKFNAAFLTSLLR